jgi:hypothetical protein
MAFFNSISAAFRSPLVMYCSASLIDADDSFAAALAEAAVKTAAARANDSQRQ